MKGIGRKDRIEVESKFKLSAEDFVRLREQGTVRSCTKQLNVYYDHDDYLADQAITLRVRYTAKKRPIMTLKIPRERRGGERRCVEVECPVEGNVARRCISVRDDVPAEFRGYLDEEMGLDAVERLGWMRTNRWLVELPGGCEVELDRVELPSGDVFYEVEVEDSVATSHRKAVASVLKLAKSAEPSHRSKFERFAEAIKETSVTYRRAVQNG